MTVNIKTVLSRRAFTAALASTGLLLSVRVRAANDKLVFVGWGGTSQEAMEAAFARPFAEQEKIQLISDSGPSLAKVKAMVISKSVQWDVVLATTADYLNMVKEDLLEPIDYSVFDSKTLSQIDDKHKGKYGVTALLYAFGIAYRTDTGKTEHPKTWKEFWDLERFPGLRAIPTGTYPVPPWEAALLADGVTPEQLYPLDYERATASLDKIKSSVKFWYPDTAAGIRSLVSGDVDYAIVPNGRIQVARLQGAKVAFEFGEAFLYQDYYVVPKGAPNKEAAMKLIAYASQSAPSAKFMASFPSATPNNDALTRIDPEWAAAALPTTPVNFSQMIPLTGEYYGQDVGNNETGMHAGIRAWNEWFGR